MMIFFCVPVDTFKVQGGTNQYNPSDERIQILQESCKMIQNLQESCKMDANLARILQDGYKSCKNLARKMEELCIPLQDFLQDSCKILNFFITRELINDIMKC